MKTHKIALIAAAVLGTGGCLSNDTGSASSQVHDSDECECKIEGTDIGKVGAYAKVGDELVVFEKWIPKADSPGEYVGFELSNADGVTYVVKAGGQQWAASGATWSNPYGNSGSGVYAISNVDFCPPDPPPPPPGGGDGDGTPIP